jgi:hypothetical protein
MLRTPSQIGNRPLNVNGLSAAMVGGTIASILWAIAWAAVASVAVRRAMRTPDGFAVFGAAVSVVVCGGGCLLAWRGLRSDHRWSARNRSNFPLGRRLTGWLASIVWCGVGAIWNIGVFGLLFRAADAGRGFWLTVLVLWSLIGWVLLAILFVGVGSIIDGARLVARETDTKLP